MGFLNVSFDNSANRADMVDKEDMTEQVDMINRYFNNINPPKSGSRANSEIIDLNKETDYRHHNVTIYGTGEVIDGSG